MVNFLVACTSTATSNGGCYDWPIIREIIMLFGYVVKYIYMFLEWIGIPNLGLCIILLTLVIKCILLPLTIQQQKFTKLSSVAQPEIKKIQARYQGKRDNYSMQAMQAETKAVYAKYGISQSMGCIQSFIQFPILIALYGAIRNIPLYVESLGSYYNNVIEAIGTTDISSISGEVSRWAAEGVTNNDKLVMLFSLPAKGWNAIMGLEGLTTEAVNTISENYAHISKVNSFLGINLGDTPWNQIVAAVTGVGAFIGIIAGLVPLISGFTQWLSFKLTQAKNVNPTGERDSMAASMNSMGIVMPLFSLFICFTLNAAIGIYWCISSLFQVLLQIWINKRYRKMDMDEFIKVNMEKAEEKAKKKREKKGVTGESLSSAANTSTKNINSQANPNSLAAKANVNVSEGTRSQTPPPPNSLAAKAALVQKYNEENGVDVDESGNSHKKYKK